MSNTYFHFQRFTVWHDKCAMKVGTDGVLLGAWATAAKSKNSHSESGHTDCNERCNEGCNEQCTDGSAEPFRVLDVGTGTGLIALFMAQRNKKARIDAIDIDRMACEQAIENIQKSPFRDRIEVIHQSFTNYDAGSKKYDLILSNPPFFANALKSPDPQRKMARHNDSLPLKLLIEHALTMLSDNGRIALILPVQSSGELDFIIATHRLYQLRRTDVVPVEGALPKRFLTEITTSSGMTNDSIRTVDDGTIETRLTLKTKDLLRTEQYKALTRDFYL